MTFHVGFLGLSPVAHFAAAAALAGQGWARRLVSRLG